MHETKLTIEVAAAAVIDKSNKVLVAKRAANAHQGGKWEFPGGKRNSGETLLQTLQRELKEELGIDIGDAQKLISLTHHYPEKIVKLSVWKVFEFSGEPRGLEGQPIKWQAISTLDHAQFPDANRSIIRALQLPDVCLVTPELAVSQKESYLRNIEQAVSGGVRMLILRNHSLGAKAYLQLAESVSSLCDHHQILCVFNTDVDSLTRLPHSNIHLTASNLMGLSCRPEGVNILGGSCHSIGEIQQANKFGLDYIFLSPVLATASHPDATALGWSLFEEMQSVATMPVFALGGLAKTDIEQAKNCGAQGIAAIQGLWPA